VTNDFVTTQREIASRWKATADLPDAARVAASYLGRGNYPFCLPEDFAAANLLPGTREAALALFAELGIPWHRGVDGGPTNHLLSSQVQCVNALMPMVDDPGRITLAFGGSLDVAEVLEIEPGRMLTFEYISPTDHLSEAVGDKRTRGANCTSVDAAFVYRTSSGDTELALVEWKFTESYSSRHNPKKTRTRAARYQALVEATDSPIRAGIPFEWLLDEPFYQLMRQQLLAQALENDPSTLYTAVRVVHVLDPANTAYQASVVNPNMREFGDTVDEIWNFVLTRSDRFTHLDPAVFLDPTVTSEEYVARYRTHASAGNSECVG
jgi:hypothetical protein